MKRLVIVATLRRGILDPREELPGEVEAAILEAEYAAAAWGNEVAWAEPREEKRPLRRREREFRPRPDKKLDRMLELAGRAG